MFCGSWLQPRHENPARSAFFLRRFTRASRRGNFTFHHFNAAPPGLEDSTDVLRFFFCACRSHSPKKRAPVILRAVGVPVAVNREGPAPGPLRLVPIVSQGRTISLAFRFRRYPAVEVSRNVLRLFFRARISHSLKKRAPVILSPRCWAKDLSSVLKLLLRGRALPCNQNYFARHFKYFFHGSQ